MEFLKVVIRAVTLVMLMLPLFADFSPRACGADSTFNWKASKAEPYRSSVLHPERYD